MCDITIKYIENAAIGVRKYILCYYSWPMSRGKVCKKVIDSKSCIIYNIFIRKILNNVRHAHPDSFCQIFQTLIK